MGAPVCRECGLGLRDGARFCDGCGSPLDSSFDRAELKQVTVMFADLVRSMDIAARVGPERLREIITALVNRSAVVVQRYGGTVNQFTGDGLMAVFGAPTALEDHALRACLAALDLHVHARELASEVQSRDGIDLQLRIGLNSGQVITGEIGSGPMGYTAIGEHVGMAQRMESVAPPGGVMLSASTARLVEQSVVLGEPEAVHIKGSADPVYVRRLLSAGDRRARRQQWEPTLVGRHEEMHTLAEIFDRTSSGQGMVIGVAGTAGIGKSRLAAEATRLAATRGIPVHAAFCESHARDVPYQVVRR